MSLCVCHVNRHNAGVPKVMAYGSLKGGERKRVTPPHHHPNRVPVTLTYGTYFQVDERKRVNDAKMEQRRKDREERKLQKQLQRVSCFLIQ